MDLDKHETLRRRKADAVDADPGRDPRPAPPKRASTFTMAAVWIAILIALMLAVEIMLVAPAEAPIVDDGGVKRRV